MSGRRIVDLFAGPGGWSEGLRMLGHRELGIEWDPDACATAIAAGHDRLQADVAELDPQEFAPCWGLIASPPCQAWSMAGKGDGRRDIEHVVACAMEIAAGNDTRAEHAAKCTDDRSLLVVEPLRWALALRPVWLAFEQVPPVLELWTLFAQILEREGWSCWTGVLEAERYGVPQTRERAILMAHRDRVAHPPQATHQRYVPGEPQRHDITLDGEILPWISMAEALSWGATALPYPTIACASDTGGPDKEKVGGSNARRKLYEEQAAGRWLRVTNDRPNATVRQDDQPAPTLAFGHERPSWLVNTGRDWKPGGSRDDAQTFDASTRPASAVDGKGRWHRPAPTIVGTRRSEDGMLVGRQLPPGEGRNVGGRNWTVDRPSTTVAGDPRVHPPGHKINANDIAAGRDDYEERRGANAIRVTLQEAAVLQSFRPDYPWHGNRSSQFRQVGNAVPPLLARAVLRELAGDASQDREAAA